MGLIGCSLILLNHLAPGHEHRLPQWRPFPERLTRCCGYQAELLWAVIIHACVIGCHIFLSYMELFTPLMIHIYCQHSLAAFTAMHFHHKKAVFNANTIFMMPGKPFSTNFIPIYTNKPINAYHIKHSFKMEMQAKREAKRKNTMIKKNQKVRSEISLPRLGLRWNTYWMLLKSIRWSLL